MSENLKLNRYIFDGQLPLISLLLGLEDLKVVTAAYAGVSNIFGFLAGKCRWAADASPPTEQNAKSLAYAAADYERALRTVGKAILTPEQIALNWTRGNIASGFIAAMASSAPGSVSIAEVPRDFACLIPDPGR